MKKTKHSLPFCPHCGTRMEFAVYPNEYLFDYDGNLHSGGKFNIETGERLYKVIFWCPLFRESWFRKNEHRRAFSPTDLTEKNIKKLYGIKILENA